MRSGKMLITRVGSAAWQFCIKDGKGTISTESGVLPVYDPCGFASRFGGQGGSSPEVLIAAVRQPTADASAGREHQ